MKVVWGRRKATASDVQAALANQRPLKDSTSRTVLLRLEEKGYVSHEVDGRTFVYACLQPPETIAARAVKQIVDRFCHGSLESLLTGMVEDEIVDHPAELQEIVNRRSEARGATRNPPLRKGRSVHEVCGIRIFEPEFNRHSVGFGRSFAGVSGCLWKHGLAFTFTHRGAPLRALAVDVAGDVGVAAAGDSYACAPSGYCSTFH